MQTSLSLICESSLTQNLITMYKPTYENLMPLPEAARKVKRGYAAKKKASERSHTLASCLG